MESGNKPDSSPEKVDGVSHRVIKDEVGGCPTCGNEHFRYYTVEWLEDGNPVVLGQSWADESAAQDVCDYMNEAYERARGTGL